MCGQVIEKRRSAFATLAGVGVIDVGFDRQTSRFFVLERDRTGNIFEIAEATRGGSFVSISFARSFDEEVSARSSTRARRLRQRDCARSQAFGNRGLARRGALRPFPTVDICNAYRVPFLRGSADSSHC